MTLRQISVASANRGSDRFKGPRSTCRWCRSATPNLGHALPSVNADSTRVGPAVDSTDAMDSVAVRRSRMSKVGPRPRTVTDSVRTPASAAAITSDSTQQPMPRWRSSLRGSPCGSRRAGSTPTRTCATSAVQSVISGTHGCVLWADGAEPASVRSDSMRAGVSVNGAPRVRTAAACGRRTRAGASRCRRNGRRPPPRRDCPRR